MTSRRIATSPNLVDDDVDDDVQTMSTFPRPCPHASIRLYSPATLVHVTDVDTITPRASLVRRIVGSPWFHLFAAFALAGLVLTFVAKPYAVPSASMEQTLQIGDRVLVDRLAYLGTQPTTGDVIVFDADDAWDGSTPVETNPLKAVLRWIGEVSGFGPSGTHTLVKRIVATAGQTVRCCDATGSVVVDGEALVEPYVFEDFPFIPGALDCTTTPRSQRCFDSVNVPADSYFVLGDHRSQSSDSAGLCRGEDPLIECWRWATSASLVGRVSVVLWPVSRWQSVD